MSACSRMLDRNRLDLYVVGLWLLTTAIICGRSFEYPYVHSLYPIYSRAGQNWQAGGDVYAQQEGLHDLFRYSPSAAVLLTPLSHLPDHVGGVFWRLLNLAAFFWGVSWWSRAVLPGGRSFARVDLALLWLVMFPLCLESLNNGQINPLVAGLLLACVAAVKDGRWNLAALCAVLAGCLKVYPLAVGLLLLVLYPRRFGPRLLVALTLVLAMPFLFQRPDFVIQEYRTWFSLLGGDDRSDWPLRIAPQDLWLIIRVLHLPVDLTIYNGLRLALATGLAALCVITQRRGRGDRELLTALSTQAICWMILCGPNSEPCTYLLLAPVLGWAVVDAFHNRHALALRCSLACVLGVCLLPLVIRVFTGGENNAPGLMPLGALLLSLHLLFALCRRKSNPGKLPTSWQSEMFDEAERAGFEPAEESYVSSPV
jgi:hypothetical protein